MRHMIFSSTPVFSGIAIRPNAETKRGVVVPR